jgi:hypothetical protein
MYVHVREVFILIFHLSPREHKSLVSQIGNHHRTREFSSAPHAEPLSLQMGLALILLTIFFTQINTYFHQAVLLGP